ncbi:hypothetical protein [Catenuloplanes japonicus]|uniref:hypothetical protein n=1 Tax=Catenuloplanes japonicus TaxID=33876 RepID=UPI000525E8DE|nr:hypothetical protein [Catenuloplanes japonicus]
MTDVIEQPLFIPGAPDPFVYTLEQVEYLTGWTVRSVMDECKAGRIDHVNRKGTYGMTREQIYKAAEAYTRQATEAANAAEAKRIADSNTMRQVAAGMRTRGRSRAKRVATA